MRGLVKSRGLWKRRMENWEDIEVGIMLGIGLVNNVELIKKLKRKIVDYKEDFSKNEALVRYALIDPFLRSLGWDTEDPKQVKPEYSIEVGRPDYALFTLGNKVPIAFIGAKKLGKNEDLQQHISYCVSEGVKYFITTDGNRWEVYDTFKQMKVPEKKIAEWDISNDSESKVAYKSLMIANLEAFGEVLEVPIFFSLDKNFKNQQSLVKGSEIESVKSSNVVSSGSGILRPVSVSINGEVYNIDKSNLILIKTAEWLISKGKITYTTTLDSGKYRRLINTEPRHKTGKSFVSSYKLSNGLYLDINYSSQKLEEMAKRLMEHFGYSKNSVIVRWSK